jgi:RND family efflux transporter MFP subunit
MLGLTASAGVLWPSLWGGPGRADHGPASFAGPAGVPAAVRVDAIRPVRGGVRRLTIQPGTVHAFESVDLFAKASGFLKTQVVDIGSPIRRGQVLAEIDAPELVRDLEEAGAALEQARARAEQAASRVATAEAECKAWAAQAAQAETDLQRLAANRTLSEKQYRRISDLSARHAVERVLVDEHQTKLDSDQAAERAGHAAIRTARAQVAVADARLLQARADVSEARAAIRVAEARLARARVLADYARVVAPFDGVVTRRTFHPGAFIRSAADGVSEPLLTVMRTDLMRVVIQVPDLDVPLLDVGDKATIAVDALKGREYTGVVARLGKREDPTTRTMRAEVDLTNGDGALIEGMYGRASIELLPPTAHLTVPAACVVGHAGHSQASVFLVRADKAHRVPVTLGLDDGTSVEVLAGLEPSDLVVLRPPRTLADGTSVVATSAATAGAARR